MSDTKAELVADARGAIENAKRKHQRWAIWEQIVDNWEAAPEEEEVRFSERLKIAEFVAENQETLKQFAGDRTSDMLIFMLRKLTPESVS